MAQIDYTVRNTAANPLYRTWHNMKMRCNNPNVPCYKNYGGRGIKVCETWLEFHSFYEDMFDTYIEGLQLDRIDNNGNYEPNNCRWVTVKQNSSNTRRSKFLTYRDKTRTVTQWAEYLGIKSSTFRQRYYVYHWPLDRLIGDYLGTS